MDVTASVAGSTLDLQVTDKPLVASEVFQVDDVAVYQLPPGASVLAGSSLETIREPEPAALAATAFGARLYPNPPGPSATLELVTTKTGFARVRIFDTQGRVVRDLLDEASLPAGRHALRFETHGPARLGAGMYFYSVQSAEGRRFGKFAILD
jgi:hypothetical protein